MIHPPAALMRTNRFFSQQQGGSLEARDLRSRTAPAKSSFAGGSGRGRSNHPFLAALGLGLQQLQGLAFLGLQGLRRSTLWGTISCI